MKHCLENRHLSKFVIWQHRIGVKSIPLGVIVYWPIDAVLKYSIGYSAGEQHYKP